MRVVILGCGTGVGKTRLSVALLRALTARQIPTLGLKPIESGVARAEDSLAPPSGSDAAALATASRFQTQLRHPLYALRDPVSPHLAARASGSDLDLDRSAAWISQAESDARQTDPAAPLWTVIETAGGIFSPLGVGLSNFHLAQRLEPAVWVLVAADALGVLHDVTSTLLAMRASGREPDHVVLSAAREPDASTGGNAAELEALGIVRPTAVLARNDDHGAEVLADRLLELARVAPTASESADRFETNP